jgi:hypothetical protein
LNSPQGRGVFAAGFMRALDLLAGPREDALPRLAVSEWNLLAGLCSTPGLRRALITHAQRSPYEHLDGYMRRWWLFNRSDLPGGALFPGLPSVRVHHILRDDPGRHLHNHPWDARTLILRGWYREERDDGVHLREEGDTVEIKSNTFHRIAEVSKGGVWTLFITGPRLHEWGFRTEGGIVRSREYLGAGEGMP